MVLLLENSFSVDINQITLSTLTKIISDFQTLQSVGFGTSYSFCLMYSLPTLPLTSFYLTYILQLISLSLGRLPDHLNLDTSLHSHSIKYAIFHDFYNMVLAFAVGWHSRV